MLQTSEPPGATALGGFFYPGTVAPTRDADFGPITQAEFHEWLDANPEVARLRDERIAEAEYWIAWANGTPLADHDDHDDVLDDEDLDF